MSNLQRGQPAAMRQNGAEKGLFGALEVCGVNQRSGGLRQQACLNDL